MFSVVISLFLGLLAISFGIRCITLPLDAYSLIPTLMGIAMLAEGISCVVVWFQNRKNGASMLLLLNGILSGVLGALLMGSSLLQLGLAAAYVTFVAIWLIISGIIRIMEAFSQRAAGRQAEEILPDSSQARQMRAVLREFSRQWVVSLILGILMILLGIISLGHPFATMITIGMYIGVDAIMIGINLILRGFSIEA